jgi:hypothetical protein
LLSELFWIPYSQTAEGTRDIVGLSAPSDKLSITPTILNTPIRKQNYPTGTDYRLPDY